MKGACDRFYFNEETSRQYFPAKELPKVISDRKRNKVWTEGFLFTNSGFSCLSMLFTCLIGTTLNTMLIWSRTEVTLESLIYRNINKRVLNMLALPQISSSACVSEFKTEKKAKILLRKVFLSIFGNCLYVPELDVNLNFQSRDCIFLLGYKSGKFIQDIYTGFYMKPLCTPK